ncbi:MAG: 2-oxoacid:acceptor oxidoreductase subunit alpha [Deltaproteobacteria bacterium]|nr:2-oxoacid:acceptor oxidoreductase subunit alpha [Deltaproteobacteria bacterium]
MKHYLFKRRESVSQKQKIINNFSVRIATANGTGSQSANNTLFKALFRMGVCASAKNLFPSNIKGLPTWYQIRTSQKGYTAMNRGAEVNVLVNKDTYKKDYEESKENSVVIYDSNIMSESDFHRDDITHYPLPLTKLASTHFEKPRLRVLLKNIIYLGAICELFKLDQEVTEQVIKDSFSHKPKVVESNLSALRIGVDYVKQNIIKKDPYYYEKENDSKNKNKIVIEGNAACALGSVYGGCTVVGWYPITPSSSLAESFISYCEKYRVSQDGEHRYAIVQAEDEMASLGIVVGAGWAGARAMTATSGPGIALMTEITGLAYYAEVPVVIFDVQRVGPSTGLPTRTQQSDLTMIANLGHGDTKQIMLFPKCPKECFELSAQAFDIAEELQTPVFVISDLDLGMNQWPSDDFDYPLHPYNRGKVLRKEDLAEMDTFRRYFSGDESHGIPSRTLPGTDHPLASYFTRGSGHDEDARYTEDPDAYRRNMMRLLKKFQEAYRVLPKPVIEGNKKAKIGIIGVGSTYDAIREARDYLSEAGIKTKYLRPKSFPFHPEVKEFIDSCDKVLVVDLNRDAQLKELIQVNIPNSEPKLRSFAYSDGMPLSALYLTRKAKELLNV